MVKTSHLAAILAAGLNTACSGPFTTNDGTSDAAGIELGYTHGMVGHVKKPVITICLSGHFQSRQEEWFHNIKDIVLKWVEPMRAISPVKLTRQVEVKINERDCDGFVVVHQRVHAHAQPSKNPTINMGRDGYMGSYNTLLHEFGHAFALNDTYQNGQSGNCQRGQPQSVMCNTSFKDLQDDDIKTLRSIYNKAYPGDVAKRQEMDARGEKPDEDGQDDSSGGPVYLAVGRDGDAAPLYVSIPGILAPLAVSLCEGSVEECKLGDEWEGVGLKERRGGRHIFRSASAVDLRSGKEIAFRLRFANGQTTYFAAVIRRS